MELRAQVHVTCEVLAEAFGGCAEGKCAGRERACVVERRDEFHPNAHPFGSRLASFGLF